MRKLTSLALAAALAPAMALGIGTIAFAETNNMNQRSEEQGDLADEQSHGRPIENGDSQDSAQREDREGMSGQDEDDDMAGQDAGAREQHLSGKPAGAFYAEEVIGESVVSRSADGDNEIGEVTDLVIGEDGRVLGVIVSTGGLMGLGEKNVALPWDQIERTMEDDEMTFSVDMDQDALENVPEYDRDE